MTYVAGSIDDYCSQIPEERKPIFKQLLEIIAINLPIGYEKGMLYNMPSFFVPKSIYPPGYHCTPTVPLPFISIASQKGFIAFYHMGIYASNDLNNWFITEYEKVTSKKPDMGKSCIRFKKPEQIPLELIAQLCSKITVNEWIDMYENNFRTK